MTDAVWMRCDVCLEHFYYPVTLPCGHTFCITCTGPACDTCNAVVPRNIKPCQLLCDLQKPKLSWIWMLLLHAVCAFVHMWPKGTEYHVIGQES